jgi:hypothetical protein
LRTANPMFTDRIACGSCRRRAATAWLETNRGTSPTAFDPIVRPIVRVGDVLAVAACAGTFPSAATVTDVNTIDAVRARESKAKGRFACIHDGNTAHSGTTRAPVP